MAARAGLQQWRGFGPTWLRLASPAQEGGNCKLPPEPAPAPPALSPKDTRDSAQYRASNHSDPNAGNLRHSSSPSSSVLNSLDCFVATRQVLRPSNRDVCFTRHVPSITYPTATVMQNNTQFSGDHHPHDRQVDQTKTFAINAAFAAWHQPPSDEPMNLAASSEALHKLLHAQPMAATPISMQQLKPLMEMDPVSAICDPSPFTDSTKCTQLNAAETAHPIRRKIACCRSGECSAC